MVVLKSQVNQQAEGGVTSALPQVDLEQLDQQVVGVEGDLVVDGGVQ